MDGNRGCPVMFTAISLQSCQTQLPNLIKQKKKQQMYVTVLLGHTHLPQLLLLDFRHSQIKTRR